MKRSWMRRQWRCRRRRKRGRIEGGANGRHPRTSLPLLGFVRIFLHQLLAALNPFKYI